MSSSLPDATVAGAPSILPPFLLGLYLLFLPLLLAILNSAPTRAPGEVAVALGLAAFFLACGVVLAWAVTYRVWATPTHLVIKSFGRVLAVRWEHVRSIAHMSGGYRAPDWLLIRTGYGAGGRTFRLVHELFRNGDRLYAAVVDRARRASPEAGIQAYVFPRADLASPAPGARPAPPPRLERFEPRAQGRDASIALQLTWRARVIALAGIVLAGVGIAHAGLSVLGWLAQGGGPGGGPGGGRFLLLVAELSLGPLAFVVSLYVLASAVRVTPAGVTVRAWGVAERAVAWGSLRDPSSRPFPGLRVLTPRSERDGSAIAALFDRRASVVFLGAYRNEGLLFDVPASGAVGHAQGALEPPAQEVP